MALSMFMNPYQHPFAAAPRRSLFADFDDMFNEMSLSRPRYSYATPMVTARSYPDYATVYRRAAPAPTRRVVYRRPAVTIVQQPQVRVLRLVSEPIADEMSQRRLKRREVPTETAPAAVTTQSTESAAAVESSASPAVAQSPKMKAPPTTAATTAVTANKRPRTTYEAEWYLSKDGSSYEWRLPIAAQSTVSNVALQLMRNVQEPSHRVLQVTVDTEHREEVALFGSWPMVSVSQQTVTRRVSLPEDAKMEGMTVTLEESNEVQGGAERTLLVKVPRQQAESVESVESAAPVENVVDTSDNHTDSATVSNSSVHASITASTTEPAVDEESEQIEQAVLSSESPAAVEETPVAKSDDDNTSQVSSDVTVEDVEEEEEEDDGYVHA